ncbi:hypothetical protein EZI54_17435 [Marinobacter halodurans]|uniref:Uncharacterized protein n=1 Tax=Marinobacter halodurans TaxID=2528979 RepID=A0ABY1ZGX3_9GAMM|nr:hypothetical protein [Marinobacter halodurans]TBW51302.1 hypothetical protein EZI54_17435 [Marinobacter halodurans]
MIAWLLIAIPVIYFGTVAVVIAHHLIAVGYIAGRTWIFGAPLMMTFAVVCTVSLVIGVRLLKKPENE